MLGLSKLAELTFLIFKSKMPVVIITFFSYNASCRLLCQICYILSKLANLMHVIGQKLMVAVFSIDLW